MVNLIDVADHVVRQALQNPQPWDEGGHIHNWRNHVGLRTRTIWHTLSEAAKIAIAGDADDRASAEEYE